MLGRQEKDKPLKAYLAETRGRQGVRVRKKRKKCIISRYHAGVHFLH